MKDTTQDADLEIFVICFQKVEGAPSPPFVIKTNMTKRGAWFTEEHGSISKNVCSSRTYLTWESAAENLNAFSKVLSETPESICQLLIRPQLLTLCS